MKNKCYELVDIFDYLQEPENYKEIGDHIKSCRECREKEEDIKKIIKILKEYEFPECPKGLEEKIKEKIKQEEKKKEEKVYRYKSNYIIAGSIAALIIIMIGLFLHNRYKTEKEVVSREIKISLIKEKLSIYVFEEEVKKIIKEIKEEVKRIDGKIIKLEKGEEEYTIKISVKKELFEDFKKNLENRYKKEMVPGNYGRKVVINIELLEE